MMKSVLEKVLRSAEVAARSQRIGAILVFHGVAGSLASLGIETGRLGIAALRSGRTSGGGFGAAFGKNLARTLVRLGPTFIKLGQILATRPDMVGEPVAGELRILFDRVTPISFREIQRILKKELGREKVKSSFRSIEPKPIGSASLSQVHRASLQNGEPVIIKVQKPGAARLVRVDLMILESLIRPLNLIYPQWQLIQMFDDFRAGTLSEIDFRKEADNIARFQKNYRKFFADSDVVFPVCYSELTTEKVLVLQPMRGKSVSSFVQGSTVARHVAAKGLEAVLEQIFDHGFFHADPHAGNLFFIEEEGRLGFIDVGLVGQLSTGDKRKFLKVVLAVLQRDRDKLALALFELGQPSKNTDYARFESAIQALLEEARKSGIAQVRLDQMLNRLLTIARENEIYIPNRYVLMMRSCLLIEGVAKNLDPNISIVKVAIPVVARSLMNTYNPFRILKRFF